MHKNLQRVLTSDGLPLREGLARISHGALEFAHRAIGRAREARLWHPHPGDRSLSHSGPEAIADRIDPSAAFATQSGQPGTNQLVRIELRFGPSPSAC